VDSTSLVKCELFSGKRHQIRVHLAHLGYPIVNDVLYGGKKDFFKENKKEIKGEGECFRDDEEWRLLRMLEDEGVYRGWCGRCAWGVEKVKGGGGLDVQGRGVEEDGIMRGEEKVDEEGMKVDKVGIALHAWQYQLSNGLLFEAPLPSFAVINE